MHDKKFVVPFRNDSSNPFENVEWEEISCINWPEKFPHGANVKFRISHDGDAIHVEYAVCEDSSLALTLLDNGPVWEDSCVEFFICFSENGYYNLEANCIGTILLAKRKSRAENVVHATNDILSLIGRKSSLKRAPFSEQSIGKWTLRLDIPKEAFFLDGISTLSGLNASMNLYKCADKLLVPHYLSWNPISTLHPDFHRPEFFREVLFE